MALGPQCKILALGPQRKIFALGMYISCCLCQFGHPTQTRFSVEYGFNVLVLLLEGAYNSLFCIEPGVYLNSEIIYI